MSTNEVVLLVLMLFQMATHAWVARQWRLTAREIGEQWKQSAHKMFDQYEVGYNDAIACTGKRLSELAQEALDAAWAKHARGAKAAEPDEKEQEDA